MQVFTKPHNYKDPVTGDELTRLEYLTRQVQQVVRSPWFILLFNIITVLAFLRHGMDVWNYFASWLAVMVEWVVGKFMWGQTGRDAVTLREVRAIAQRVEDIAEVLLKDVETIEEQLEEGAPSVAYSKGKEPVEGQKTLHKNE